MWMTKVNAHEFRGGDPSLHSKPATRPVCQPLTRVRGIVMLVLKLMPLYCRQGSKQRVTLVQYIPHFVTILKCGSPFPKEFKDTNLLKCKGSHLSTNLSASNGLNLTEYSWIDQRAPEGQSVAINLTLYYRVSILFLHMSSPFKPPHLWPFLGGLN